MAKKKPRPPSKYLLEVDEISKICPGIHFTIKKISNIVDYIYPLPLNCQLKLEFNDDQIGCTDSFNIKQRGTLALDLKINFPITDFTMGSIQQFMSCPFIFTLVSDPSNKVPSEVNISNIIGCGNMDILPLLLGKEMINEDIPLDSPDKLAASRMRISSEIPRMEVIAKTNNFSLTCFDLIKNVLFFTVESIYNFDDNKMMKNFNQHIISAATDVPKSLLDSELISYEMLKFEKPSGEIFPDEDRKKRWASMSNYTGRSKLTKYRMSENSAQIKRNKKLDISSLDQRKIRIQWNSLRRMWLSNETEESILKYISKYKFWPVEFQFQKNVILNPEQGHSTTKSNKRHDSQETQNDIYVAFFDVSNFLHPGIRKLRAASQLFLWNKKSINAWELLFLLSKTSNTTYKQEDSSTKLVENSENVTQSVSSKVKGKTKKTSSTKEDRAAKMQDEFNYNEIEGLSNDEVIPIVANDGKAVFAIIEIELLNPFFPCRKREEILKDISELIPPRMPLNDGESLMKASSTEFTHCIRDLSVLISNEFKEFKSAEEIPRDWEDTYITAEESSFFKFLQKKGVQDLIKETLREKIINYIQNNIGCPYETSPLSLQMYFSSLYGILVNKMHETVNGMVSDYNEEYDKHISLEKLLYFAHESTEQEEYSKAKEYLLRRIEINEDIVSHWLDYAVFSLRINNVQKAIECIKEALKRDATHKDSLLMFAVLLAVQGKFDEAKSVFEALTELHPMFHHGWISFCLYYKMIERQESADVCLVAGSKSMLDPFLPIIEPGVLAISWSPIYAPEDNVFLQTTVYLLSHNLYMFAELCLSQELDRAGKSSKAFEYYLGVCHYLQGRHEDSNYHLQQALVSDRNVAHIWSLMGHNYFNLGKKKSAHNAYACFMKSSKDQNDQLTCLRMANYLLENKNFGEAKDTFLKAITCYSTPLGWLGLGITYIKLKDLNLAERALVEVNLLDNQNSQNWFYLGIVNLLRNKTDQFKQCIIESKRALLSSTSFMKEFFNTVC